MKIDVRGEVCPVPVIKAKKALQDLKPSETVSVLVDNKLSMENLCKLADEKKFEKSVNILSDKEYEVTIVKGEEVQDKKDTSQDVVVAIGTDQMGEGAEELGKNLLKAFIFALTELEQPPKTVLFYNGGARMTVDSSPALEDIRKLENMGSEILTCGTCLNYYGLSEKLSVGSVTNMYTIVERLSQAGTVVRP